MIKFTALPKNLSHSAKQQKNRRASGDTAVTEPASASQFLPCDSLDTTISELTSTLISVDKSIESAKIIMAYRLETGGKNAAAVALTQLRNYRAVKEHTQAQIDELERFSLNAIQDQENFQQKVHDILSTRPVTFSYEETRDAEIDSLQRLLVEF